MPRAKGGFKSRQRRKKTLKRASGFFSSNSRCFQFAKEKSDRALVYAFRDRKVRKRYFRRLWITRINAICREMGTNYSTLMHDLKKRGVELDRKILADLAVHNVEGFKQLVSQKA